MTTPRTMTATDLGQVNPNARGDQRLYRVDPPMSYDDNKTTEYVVVSAVDVFDVGEPETYIFPSDKDGTIVDWLELDGSYKGSKDHEQALRYAGYEVTK